MTTRTVSGLFYIHGGRCFAFLQTEQPYDILGCAELSRQAQSLSGDLVGTVQIRFIEDPAFPHLQGFAVMPSGRIGRQRFTTLVNQIFPNCTVTARWVTNADGVEMFLGLIMRKYLQTH